MEQCGRRGLDRSGKEAEALMTGGEGRARVTRLRGRRFMEGVEPPGRRITRRIGLVVAIEDGGDEAGEGEERR